MKKLKILFGSALFILCLIIILTLINWLFFRLLDWFILDLINWFLKKSTFLKLFITFFGGAIIFGLMNFLLNIIGFLGKALLGRFPYNNFTKFGSIIISTIFILIGVYSIWSMPNGYGFWTVIILLQLSAINIVVNGIFFKRTCDTLDEY